MSRATDPASAIVAPDVYVDDLANWKAVQQITVEAFGKELQALSDAGCRYVQIDETAFAKFGDPEVQATLTARKSNATKFERFVVQPEPPELRVSAYVGCGSGRLAGSPWSYATVLCV